MSRIGKKSIPLPAGVKVNVANSEITVEGKLGKLQYSHRPEIEVKVDDGQQARRLLARLAKSARFAPTTA